MGFLGIRHKFWAMKGLLHFAKLFAIAFSPELPQSSAGFTKVNPIHSCVPQEPMGQAGSALQRCNTATA
jgi:hypothetical protein